MAERIRKREIGYIDAAHVDQAAMAVEDALRTTRTLITTPMGAEERNLRYAKLLDSLHEAKDELGKVSSRRIGG